MVLRTCLLAQHSTEWLPPLTAALPPTHQPTPRPPTARPRCRASRYDEDQEDLRFSGLTGAGLVHESLVECGVQHVFGYSGGANLPILDQFHKSPIT